MSLTPLEKSLLGKLAETESEHAKHFETLMTEFASLQNFSKNNSDLDQRTVKELMDALDAFSKQTGAQEAVQKNMMIKFEQLTIQYQKLTEQYALLHMDYHEMKSLARHSWKLKKE